MKRTKSGPQGSKRCVEFKCYHPDDCALAGYCIPSKDDEPIDQIVYPGTSGIAPGLSKVVG